MIALLYLFPTGRTLNARHARVLAMFMWMVALAAAATTVQPSTATVGIRGESR